MQEDRGTLTVAAAGSPGDCLELAWSSSLLLSSSDDGALNQVPLCCLEGASHAGWCRSVGWAPVAEKLDAWPRCWVPYAEVAAAVAAAQEGREGDPSKAIADVRSAIATLAEAHGGNFVWCPRFGVIHDALPGSPSPSSSSSSPSTPPPPPPFHPPGEETPISMHGRVFGGPEQYLAAMRSAGTPQHPDALRALSGAGGAAATSRGQCPR